MSISAMVSFANKVINGDTGYNQAKRWTFFNKETRTFIPHKETDCSAFCGAIAAMGGYPVDLSGWFYTGNMRERMLAAGFEAIPFSSVGLSKLKPGDFVLSTNYHVEFVGTNGMFASASIDENGNATGGKPGNQTGKETRWIAPYIYRHGWNYVLRLADPNNLNPNADYNLGKFPASYIKNVQTLLVSHGYSVGTAGVDGSLGPATYKAVLEFQKDHALVQDGVPGPVTLAALSKAPSKPSTPPTTIGGTPTVGKTVTIDGQPVAVGTANAFYKLRDAFKRATGLNLLVTSGYRSYAQQKSLYDRWKAGTFSAPSVARPGTSLHESGRALDLRDSGSTPGVTKAGNKRSNWMRANAAKYGFKPNGYNFREPWHFEYQGDPWAGGSTSTSTSSGGAFSAAYIRDIQSRLTRLGFSVGSSGIDGSKGPATNAAILAFQKKYGLVQDALPGPATLKKLKLVEVQKAVRAVQDGSSGPDTKKRVDAVRKSSAWGGKKFPWGVAYTQGVVGTTKDNSWGPNSIKAHDATVRAIQVAVGVKADSIWGPATDSAVRSVVG